ncbi:ABC transporter permease [Agaribacterium sp. ZY112]|uniref:ABC transporter permease n=1 Tax=Agaribacterium sp. ZY112 TaxID=3233574 RepID=UPI003523308F
MGHLFFITRVAFLKLQQSLLSSVLAVLVLCAGVSVFFVVLTVLDAASKNPFSDKDERLYSLRLSAWQPDSFGGLGRASSQQKSMLYEHAPVPKQLIWRDALAIFNNNSVWPMSISYLTGAKISREGQTTPPFLVTSRAVTGRFFSMFEVPLLYGASWEERFDRPIAGSMLQDRDTIYPIILSNRLSQQLFKLSNSVGKQLNFSGRRFEVVGVIDEWAPAPKVHDLEAGVFGPADQSFIPFYLAVALELDRWGGVESRPSFPVFSSFDQGLVSDLAWIQFWLELDGKQEKEVFEQWLQGYIDSERKAGRFTYQANFYLDKPSELLVLHSVVGSDLKMMLVVALIFLIICILNFSLIVYSRFSRASSSLGVQLSLGASRSNLFIQQCAEVFLLSTLALCFSAFSTHVLLFVFEGLHASTLSHRLPIKEALFYFFVVLIFIVFCASLLPSIKIMSATASSLLKKEGRYA